MENPLKRFEVISGPSNMVSCLEASTQINTYGHRCHTLSIVMNSFRPYFLASRIGLRA
jgi:hypothetical protein